MSSNQKVPQLKDSVLIVGGGVFGIGLATELRKRGYTNVTVVDETMRGNEKETGKPNPLASSTDISKVVRSDYG